MIGEADFIGVLLDELTSRAQLMSRHAWEEMMNRLILQAAMEEVQPCWTGNVHGRAQHLRRKRFVGSLVLRRHAEVRERDLHVQRHGHHIADENVGQALRVRRNGADQEDETTPEHADAENLDPTVRASGKFVEIDVRLDLQVEASEAHDDVVGEVLKLDDPC